MTFSSRSVEVEITQLLFRHVPAVLAANIFNSSLVVAALWQSTNRGVLLGWALAVIVLALGRVGVWYGCRHRIGRIGAAMARWRLYYTIGAMVSGLLWGSTAVLFLRHDDPLSMLLVSFVIGGMGAGAASSLSPHLPAFYAYLLCSILPLEWRLLEEGGRVPMVMAGMVVVFVLGLVMIARNLNAVLVRMLELNEEKQSLLSNREQEVLARTADLQQANSRLESEIAERRNAEAAVMEARGAAEQASLAKSRFLAAASHDLRQPLQAMFLFAASLHRHVATEKGAETLARIERGLDTLKTMLDSLLDMSRLDVNVLKPEIRVFALGPMLDDLVVAYRQVAANKGLALRSGTVGDVTVRSDPTLLGRMVRNLIENAIRYTESGHIRVSSRVCGAVVRVEVEDTGIGIPPDQITRIFEEFHQVGGREPGKARGLGLGLSIVQRLSSLLGHPVNVVSETGKGSTFAIEIPLAPPEGGGSPLPGQDRTPD